MSDERFQHERARADFYRFIAACYYEPGPEFAEEALFDSMLDAARVVDPTLAAGASRLREAYSRDSLENLLVDYTRLFLGPTEILAPPYGSFWLTGEKTLMQDATLAVLDLYREGGFEMDGSFRELPDHVAAELEFLYLLTYRHCEAQENGVAHAAAAFRALRRRLLSEHLGRWIDPFTAAMQRSARTPFYRRLADITREAVVAEARTMA